MFSIRHHCRCTYSQTKHSRLAAYVKVNANVTGLVKVKMFPIRAEWKWDADAGYFRALLALLE